MGRSDLNLITPTPLARYDVREEYWTEVREMPENKNISSFRSEGKH